LFQKTLGKGRRVLKPTERLRLYEELTPTEKYFFLLETLWVDTDWRELQSYNPSLLNVPRILEFLGRQQPGEEIKIKEWGSHPLAGLFLGWGYFPLYFSYFGFWRTVPEVNLTPKGRLESFFLAESVIPTAFGVALAPILNESRPFLLWNLQLRREFFGEWKVAPGSPLSKEAVAFLRILGLKEPEPKPGEPFFLPFVFLFPKGELQRTLPREGIKFLDGVYVFKVSLAKDLWRRIEVSADHTLLDLHRAIQEAYRFDDDHLYSFFMDGKAWSRKRFASTYEDEGPYVDEVRIGELGLSPGQKILYLFDYGDEWRFRVELEEIRSEGRKPRKPRIIERRGRAPEQYSRWE